MKLYDAEWAPSPRKVRIFLAEKGIEVERILIDLKTNEQLGAAFLAINPHGTVPVLQLDDGTLLDDSLAICRMFEALHPDPPLFGRTPREIGLIEAWTRRIEADGYGAVVNALRNSAPTFANRGLAGHWPPMPQIEALVERGRLMWRCFLDTLDAQLAESAWVAGDVYSFADITAMVAVDFSRVRSAGLEPALDRPNVARWYGIVSARPSAAA